MMSLSLKICGVQTAAIINAAYQHGAKFAGFVCFEKSPRHVTIKQLEHLLADVGGRMQTVVVCVNPDDAFVSKLAAIKMLDYIQLHGDESVERIKEIHQKTGKKIIKAVSVSNAEDISRALVYEDVADMLLFDAKTPKGALPGGEGLSFDWSLMQNITTKTPWFLAGGIHGGNIGEAVLATNASYIDVSSGVEAIKGVKDVDKVTALLDIAQTL